MAAHFKSGGRYPVLRSIAILMLIGAVLTLVGGIVGGIWALVYGWGLPAGDRIWISAVTMAGGFLGALFIFAGAELVKLFIDMEHNTRVSAMASATNGSAISSSGAGSRMSEMDEETAEGALLRGH